MKTAFYFDSKELSRSWSLNISNQALSGTDGTLLQIYVGLLARDEDVHLLCTSEPDVRSGTVHLVGSLLDAYDFCTSNDFDFLVFIAVPSRHQEDLFRRARTDKKVRLIAWAQCTPSFEWLNSACECDSFYKLVAVSNIQRNSWAYHPAYAKTFVIFNFVEDLLLDYGEPKHLSVEPTITYVGALRPSKGFQHVAKAWGSIRERMPSAVLNVCGSPGLYSSSLELGEFGIAEAEFEREILSHLGLSREGAAARGVSFLGSVPKKELYGLMNRSHLVIVNPNTVTNGGSTETFCVSAAEAMAVGTPVVGAYADGLIEIVGNNIGGMLTQRQDELIQAVVTLLQEEKLREALGEKARKRANSLFNKSGAVNRWLLLLNNKSNAAGEAVSNVNTRLPKFYLFTVVRLFPLRFTKALKRAKRMIGW